MTALPYVLGDIIIPDRPDTVTESDETESGTEVPSKMSAAAIDQSGSSNQSLYIALFAIAVAVVALFALIKRGALSAKTAE